MTLKIAPPNLEQTTKCQSSTRKLHWALLLFTNKQQLRMQCHFMLSLIYPGIAPARSSPSLLPHQGRTSLLSDQQTDPAGCRIAQLLDVRERAGMCAGCELFWFFLKEFMKIKTQQTQSDKVFVLGLNASTEKCLTHHPNCCKLNQETKKLKNTFP